MNTRTETAKENISKCDEILFYGLLFLLFLIPLVFSTSLYRSFEIPKVVLLRTGAAVLFLGWWLLPGRHGFLDLVRSSTIFQAVLLVLCSAGIATCFSIEPTLSIFGIYDRQLGLLSIAAVTVFFVVISERTDGAGRTGAIVRVMTCSGALVAAYALVQYFGIDPLSWADAFGNRPASSVGHPDYLGDLLVMTIPLCLALVYWERPWGAKAAWIICFILQIGALLVSQTRGAWIAAAVTIPLFMAIEPFLHRKNRDTFRLHTIVSGVVLVVALATGLAVFLTHEPLRERAASIVQIEEQPRLYLWRDSISVINESPLVGTGPETFRLAFMPYKSMDLAQRERNTNYDTPHNNYLHVWATTGILGMCSYLYLLLCCFRVGIRKLSSGVNCNDGILSLGLVIVLSAYSIAMLTGVETITTMLCVYVLAGLIAAEESKSGRLFLSMNGNQVHGSWGKKAGALVLVFCAAAVLFDSTRIVSADHRALTGLQEVSNGTWGGIDNGRKLLEEAVELLPRESFYSLQAGVAALTAGCQGKNRNEVFGEAIVWAERSFEHGWAPENSWNLISTAYLNLGNWDEAEKACRQGLALDPYNVPLTLNLAKALALSGKREEALKVTEEILLIDEEAVEARKLQDHLLREGRTRDRP